MSKENVERAKSIASSSIIGLNAAAVFWLYTNFVPRVEFDRLHEEVKELRQIERVNTAKIAVLQVMQFPDGNPFE